MAVLICVSTRGCRTSGPTRSGLWLLTTVVVVAGPEQKRISDGAKPRIVCASSVSLSSSLLPCLVVMPGAVGQQPEFIRRGRKKKKKKKPRASLPPSANTWLSNQLQADVKHQHSSECYCEEEKRYMQMVISLKLSHVHLGCHSLSHKLGPAPDLTRLLIHLTF